MKLRPFVALASLLLAGCPRQDEVFTGSLDAPGPLALVRGDGLFTRPVAVTADRHGGRLRLIDLTTGRYAPTRPTAAFLRDAALPLGRDRLIHGVAALSPDPQTLTAYAIDNRYDTLVRAPWIVGRDDQGFPVRAEPRVVSVQVDAAEDRVQVSPVVIERGEATTETWTLTFDGRVWQARGSRSGPVRPAPATGAWTSEGGAIRLTIRGNPSEGDRIQIELDSGVEEIDLGGRPESLSLSPDGAHLAVTFQIDDGTGGLRMADPMDGSLRDPLPLPAGAKPGRMDWDAAGQLWVADRGLRRVHRIDPVSLDIHSIELPWPVFDVAPVITSRGEERLVLAPAEGAPSVWVYDLESGRFIDANPSAPGVQGMPLLAPIQGLAALPEPYPLPFQRDPFSGEPTGAAQEEATVAISLSSGKIIFVRADNGCLVSDRLGPRTRRRTTAGRFGDYTPEFPINPPFTAHLAPAEDSTRHIVVSACAGVARQETWRLTYDANVSAWVARGSISKVQDALVEEDTRYTNDNGSFSLLIRAGSTPSVDGWQISFDVLEGVLEASALDVAGGLPRMRFDLPGDPIAYIRDRGPTDDDERPDARVPEVAVAAQAEDAVMRVDARNGLITAIWD